MTLQPSIKLVREALDYDPSTGRFTWKERPVSHFSCGTYSADRACAAWNGKCAGKPALIVKSKGYLQGGLFGKTMLAHRVAWAISYNEWPDFIDHINGVRSDNRIENLRSCSKAENARNNHGATVRKADFKGLGFEPRTGKWMAKIRHLGVQYHLGTFENQLDAARAYDKAAIEKHGEFACLNFPNEQVTS